MSFWPISDEHPILSKRAINCNSLLSEQFSICHLNSQWRIVIDLEYNQCYMKNINKLYCIKRIVLFRVFCKIDVDGRLKQSFQTYFWNQCSKIALKWFLVVSSNILSKCQWNFSSTIASLLTLLQASKLCFTHWSKILEKRRGTGIEILKNNSLHRNLICIQLKE